jgi:hypothetical protein
MDVQKKGTRGEKIRTIRREGGNGRMNSIQDKKRGREGRDGYKKMECESSLWEKTKATQGKQEKEVEE